MLLIKHINSILLVFIISVLTQSCNIESNNANVDAEPQKEETLDGTSKMIELLKEAGNTLDPMQIHYYENRKRADLFRKMVEKASKPIDQLKGQIQYSNELLNAGHNEDAIMVLENLLSQLTQMKYNNQKVLRQIYRLLALAYIRLGEQNNCIERYNEDRCIIPFQGGGIYEIKQSVRKAIEIYKTLLAENGEDYESIWMLNFAYMTLGEYPHKVPEKWRLDEKEFESDYQMTKFPNIAHKLGLNTLALSGGICVDDFNNDGFLDLFASSWGFDDQMRFFKNNGDGTFSDMTETCGIKGLTGGLNMKHCDYNNDGWLDVFVLRGAWFGSFGKIPNSLLRNNGDGTFSDVTIEVGLLSHYPTQTAAWADFNNDGWLDVFIGNEALTGNSRFPCELFMNNGDGTFTNKIETSGLGNIIGMAKGVSAGDVDNDGFPDLYLSFMNAKNRLFLNNGSQADGGVTFRDFPAKEQVEEPASSFPCWFWDYNNDGWQDIFVASFGFPDPENSNSVAEIAAKNFLGLYAGSNPRLYENKGDGTFADITQEMNLMDGMFAMGSNYGDIDNDGWLDFYLGTGDPSYTAVVPNKMFRNNAGKTFQDVTTTTGLGHVQKGHGVGFGDFDNDGDQDIFCVFGGAFEGDIFGDALFLNPIGNEKNWVTLILEGTSSNRSAIGARVKITTELESGKEMNIHRTVTTGGSFGSNSLQLETGLGEAVRIKTITVKWPNPAQTEEVFQDIDINRTVKLKEGSAKAMYLERKAIQLQN